MVSRALRGRPLRGRPNLVGFTLIELLVVLTLMALVATLTLAAWSRWQEGQAYREAVHHIHQGLLQARHLAFQQALPVAYVFDMQQRRYGFWVSGQSKADWRGSWPSALQLQLTVAAGAVPEPWQGILFMPDGGATGGTIRILRPSQSGTALRVDWLTGRVDAYPVDE
ncbi:pilus assembly FimT family protein [Tepidimonas alkaliphilus]|uniref:pilus assembly FimT family protein n=1 Tax=Tepidimonas alkaliphilus TaxID=2588942 RepID=UPI003CCC483B